MRRMKAISVVAIAAIALFAAGTGLAADSCVVESGAFQVDLVDVSDVACALGTCTRYEYVISGIAGLDAAHAALAFQAFFTKSGDPIQIVETYACGSGTCVPSTSVSVFLPGETDSFTGLGGELTVQGVRINSASVREFAIDIFGSGLSTAPATAAVQASGKGDKVSACLIDGPASNEGNPELAETKDVCFERNGCKACFSKDGDGFEFDPANSNIGGPGCEQGGLMIAPGVALNLPGEASPVALKAVYDAQVGSAGAGGTFGEGSCPFIYTKNDGSIGGFCDCFGVFENGFFVQKDPLSICGPPNGCCEAGPFGGVNNSCGLSPVRNIGAGYEGPMCPSP